MADQFNSIGQNAYLTGKFKYFMKAMQWEPGTLHGLLLASLVYIIKLIGATHENT